MGAPAGLVPVGTISWVGTSHDAVYLLPSRWSLGGRLAGWLMAYNLSVICISYITRPTLNFQNSRKDVNAIGKSYSVLLW